MSKLPPIEQLAWWTSGVFRKDHLLNYPDVGYGAWANCGKKADQWTIIANREPRKCVTCLRLAQEARKP